MVHVQKTNQYHQKIEIINALIQTRHHSSADFASLSDDTISYLCRLVLNIV